MIWVHAVAGASPVSPMNTGFNTIVPVYKQKKLVVTTFRQG